MKMLLLSALCLLLGTGALAQQADQQQLSDKPQPKPYKSLIRKVNPFQTVNVNSKAFQEVTAQFAHTGAGYGVVTGMRIAGHNEIGLIGMGSFVLGKEFIYDAKFEHQHFKENLADTLFYALGMGAAVAQDSLERPKRMK